MRHITVKDVTTTDVVAVTENTPFKKIVNTLQDEQISGLPVIDDEGAVVGVVSEVDLVRKEAHPGARRWPWRLLHRGTQRKAAATKAGDLLTAPPVTVRPDTPIDEAAQLFVRHRIRRLPVVNAAGRLVGIVSPKDLLRVFLRSDADIERAVARDVFERGLWVTVNPATVTIHVHDGVVTLGGVLQLRSLIPAAIDMTRQVDGVVDVVDELSYIVDDTHQPALSDVDMAAERWDRR